MICDHVEAWARARPGSVTRVKNSLVVRLDPARPPREPGPAREDDRLVVALCGHLDTVPPHPEDAERPPRRDGAKLVALGASDMKSGLAVMMELAERLPRDQRAFDLLLVFYSREEGPFEENELGDVLREVPELRDAALAVCLEPTGNHLQLGCVGSIHATLTFSGRAAHSARPWHGVNAVHAAGPLLAHLATLAPRDTTSGGLPFREVMSVTRVDGGRARNVVPDRCTLNLNYRFAPDKTLAEAEDDVMRLASRFGAAAVLTDRSPACAAYAEHPLVKRFVARTGVRVEPKQAWTDVARLATAGIPAVNFGPGATEQAHQAGEWVDLAALPRCYELLASWLSV